MSEQVIIVGSGPAGLTAAVYAARADLNPFMVEGIAAGGQLMLTTDVENYPGFPDGIMGPELMEQFRKQAERFGTRIVTADATRVDFSSRPFKVWVDADEYEADSVIVSTGASASWLGLENEERLRGHGVSACATCDGFFFRGLEVAAVGGGDSAMEEAIFLAKFADKVNEFRASKIMVRRVLDHDKIDILWNTVVEDVLGESQVEGLTVRNVETDEVSEFKANGLFLAIGHKPNTDLFQGQLELDDVGYIVLPGPGTMTSVEGVFAAGDVADHTYRQAITAAGTGCMAAIDAERWLAEQE
jgi:thioredoxin reductase (NADPH)